MIYILCWSCSLFWMLLNLLPVAYMRVHLPQGNSNSSLSSLNTSNIPEFSIRCYVTVPINLMSSVFSEMLSIITDCLTDTWTMSSSYVGFVLSSMCEIISMQWCKPSWCKTWRNNVNYRNNYESKTDQRVD